MPCASKQELKRSPANLFHAQKTKQNRMFYEHSR